MQEEIEELEHILGEYDTFESESNRLLSDDIKIVYKKKKDLKGSIEELTKKQEEAEKKQKEVNQNLQILDEQLNELDNRLVQARVSLRQMDGARIVEEERRRLALLKKKRENGWRNGGSWKIFRRKSAKFFTVLWKKDKPQRKRRFCHPCAEAAIRWQRRNLQQMG